MACEKMRLALPRINNDILGMQLEGTDSLTRKFHRQKHSKSFSEAHRVSSLSWSNSDDRCPVLTFLTFEPNGQWRIVAIPFHYPNTERLAPNGLVSTVQDDHRQYRPKGAGTSMLQPRSPKKASNKTKWKDISKRLNQKALLSSEPASPSAVSTSGTIKPTPVLITESNVDDSVRKSPKKKNKKKAKQGNKNPCHRGSTEAALLHENHLCTGSFSGTCDNNIADHKEIPKELISHGKEVEMLEQAKPVFDNLPEIHSVGDIGKQSLSRDSEDDACVRNKDPNHAQVNVLAHSSKRWEKENPLAEFSVPPASSSFRKSYSGCKNLSGTSVDSCNNVDKTSHVHQGGNGRSHILATLNRKNVQKKTFPEFSNFCSYKVVGNHRGLVQKENTLAVWKKVQRISNSDTGESKVPIHSHLDEGSSLLTRYSNDFEHAKKLKDQASTEWKIKTESASQTLNSADSAKLTLSPLEIPCSSSIVIDQTVMTSESRSPSHSESVCSTHFDLKGQTSRDPHHSWPKVMEMKSLESLPISRNSIRQGVRSVSLADSSMQNRNPSSGVSEWRPIRLKDLGLKCSEESSFNNTVANVIPGAKEVTVECGSARDKISEAVNEAHKFQLVSEAVEKLSGCPLAEFERLLGKSSPVIYQPPLSVCSVCPRDKFSGATLCRHEKPDLSLESIWKWYEELGACGLEVNSEDYENAKRLGADFFPFSAYFVPYLSAVQIFGNRDTVSNSEVFDSSSCIGETSLHSVMPMALDEPELLYEYFEPEPPQQRRPLYEMIQHLVNGDGLSQTQGGQGDPTNLYRVKLSDLHHNSWYSVAWYPIYRIPEGLFRASFLTFHSLGHLVCRNTRFDSNGVQDCIVCPAVGLQSYNARAECWFSPRSSTPNHVKEIVLGTKRSAILKERLRTLEETASAMSRAVVKKGNKNFVNHHPDYEFFFSRKHF